MYDIETASEANLNPIDGFRGGWLASEVGMGKVRHSVRELLKALLSLIFESLNTLLMPYVKL